MPATQLRIPCGVSLRQEWQAKHSDEDFDTCNPQFPRRSKRSRRREIGAKYGEFRIHQKRRDIWRRMALALATQPAPQFVPAKTLEERFHEQAEKWDRETAHLSAPSQRFAHASYLAILGMANDQREEVIDLLLRDMQRNRREWFWALSYLTHENPVERKESGKLDKMIDAWVRWGRHRGRL
jgi:hypothetical protein